MDIPNFSPRAQTFQFANPLEGRNSKGKLERKALGKQGRIMQRIAERHMGTLPIIGDIGQVKIPDVDRGKLDAPCLTVVVVEISYEIIDCYLYYF